jgi:glycerol-3-phosphate acyltransferase PlsX
MGGDRAPGVIVEGAVRASRFPGYEIVLVGREEAIRPLLDRHTGAGRITVVNATQVIEMGESPAQAVRRKRDASLVVCGELVKTGAADAFVSAGNTGAGMFVAKLHLRPIQGIDRPAIAAILPRRGGRVVMLDAGANVDCSPLNLLQFAVMGSIYAEQVLHIEQPRVGLLNIGEEEAKGNDLTRDVFPLLRNAPVRFIGNVEGRDIFRGGVDVVVCDGFVGNVVLKVGEGVAEFLPRLIKDELRSRPVFWIPAMMLAPALRRIKKKIDYEEVGGAPLLGVNGICIIAHGSSNANAVTNAIRAAGEAVSHGIIDRIRSEIVGSPAHAAAG